MEAIRQLHLHDTVTRPEAFRLQLFPAQAGKHLVSCVHLRLYQEAQNTAHDRTDINQVQ